MASSIILIATIGEDHCLAVKGQPCFKITEDGRRFRQITEGRPIIMGRKTFEAMGSKPIPNRVNIIVSHSHEKYENHEVMGAKDLEQALKIAKKIDREEVYVIGGAEIFKQAIKLADELLITYVRSKAQGATCFFPKIDEKVFVLNKESELKTNRQGLKFSFREYSRKEKG